MALRSSLFSNRIKWLQQDLEFEDFKEMFPSRLAITETGTLRSLQNYF